ncbi:golgin candidate 5 [Malania oleifera]|uniref:golgin candidate 5 n=1 Tax=Malania oleifera TaxID=397392 RepID=UPI0025ADE83F|nr:golgin candidate 5 [Malania oleifera]XP_057954886.1 golgin candidate 5 [Malania oleifera]XP_057954887.1 golgin candidate 5 [Malania oleifera]XP_057954888.1 golgin candidate 5 [Malania oleifera]XP_057954889.1 golgin candidate 5 [Malania oleifera]XP_057954890.1 golgin candidate 5 [Malania oleifera]XP_057954891.1 golgin candidate 5 [Malania oleifera]XP_057954892.1 golgin candidate 5 [Malania oleifera]XP_057954893.1 golgin candidate 5 [Malania oleifera]XP_057954894.1 golgin candidate 5 [Mal
MAWFSGKVSLGGFPDLAGAVNKLSESVKNIEKNFDNALGFEEKSDSAGEASGMWPSATDRKALFDPVMAFMGQKDGESAVESSEQPESLQHPTPADEKEEAETDISDSATGKTVSVEEENEVLKLGEEHSHPDTTDETNTGIVDFSKPESHSQPLSVDLHESTRENLEMTDSFNQHQQKESTEVDSSENLQSAESKPLTVEVGKDEGSSFVPDDSQNAIDLHESTHEQKTGIDEVVEQVSPGQVESSGTSQDGGETKSTALNSVDNGETESAGAGELPENHFPNAFPSEGTADTVSKLVSHETDTIAKEVEVIQQANDYEPDNKEHRLSSATSVSDADSVIELEKVKMEMKMMETALQGAARQAQAKADEIAKLMNENEQLKSIIEDFKRKSNEAEVESLREEYHQRVAALERKVYALTKERDTLRREQSKKSDAAALLKEKDEIINQVMAEGEELSKKQAAQESQIRKLRAQIREFEEEKKGLLTKLQVEENKVESIKKDKTATEKLLQETIEKHQAELMAQKEYFTNALTAAKEAEALAEARANNEARTELESRLREAEEREAMLVQALEELRQTLSRKEQQAVFREDILHKDVEDLQKRYQASERRCEELITQVPESTRPLLRQIEAMQETTARRAEAWAAVERSLNSRLQEAEAKAAAAEERERSVNERLSQTLSRINVLEAQISCLRAEQTQLSRSLEKERQRAAENRQEYLAAKEEADTHEGRANQLEEELGELRRKLKEELQDALAHRELLQQEIEREKTARMDLERTTRLQSSSAVSDQTPKTKHGSIFENGNLTRKLSSATSLGSMEESYFLQASLDSSDSFSERRNFGETTMTPYYMKSMTPSAFEAALRQKEGELASYMSRLASMESIRDSLAEELVKMTAQCEKLQAESAMLPGLRAELEALRRRHSSALELMGERDEELEELRADIVDLKEMYREQVNLLVNKIQTMSSSMGHG